MGPPGRSAGIVLERSSGVNVWDMDGNRYVDLAAGFGSLLLGHGHPDVVSELHEQSQRLMVALGDVFPSDAKVQLLERLVSLYPEPARAFLAQSGSDAISGALKTAALASGRPRVIAFGGAYHGLGYGPLAACGLRDSYREPFAGQLGSHVRFVPYPAEAAALADTLVEVQRELASGSVGAILVEPILGRGGVVVPPPEFLPQLLQLTREHSALLIADEIWTGLGRSGALCRSLEQIVPDLICLGKGLGGGAPVSAVIGRAAVMEAWRRPAEVVHTSTFAGSPPACRAALTTFDVLERDGLVQRARKVGMRFHQRLTTALAPFGLGVRGAGLMLGLELGGEPGAASRLMQSLLERGYLTTTGGGKREVLVLTPPLIIDEALLDGFCDVLPELLRDLRS